MRWQKIIFTVLFIIGIQPTPAKAIDICEYLHPDTTQISAAYILFITLLHKFQNQNARLETTLLGIFAAGAFNFLAIIERLMLKTHNCPASP